MGARRRFWKKYTIAVGLRSQLFLGKLDAGGDFTMTHFVSGKARFQSSVEGWSLALSEAKFMEANDSSQSPLSPFEGVINIRLKSRGFFVCAME